MAYECEQCRKEFERKRDLTAHVRLSHEVKQQEPENLFLEEGSDMQDGNGNGVRQELIDRYGETKARGLLEAPETAEDAKKRKLDDFHRAIVETMDISLEVARLTSPANITKALDEVLDKDVKQLVVLDHFERTYRALAGLYQLDALNRKALERYAKDLELLPEDEPLADAPQTALEPVLQTLAQRVGRTQI
jgi:hypothetical protein